VYGCAPADFRGWLDSHFISRHTREFEAFRRILSRQFRPRGQRGQWVLSTATDRFCRDILRANAFPFWWRWSNQGHEATRPRRPSLIWRDDRQHWAAWDRGHSITESATRWDRGCSRPPTFLAFHDFQTPDIAKRSLASGYLRTCVPTRIPGLRRDPRGWLTAENQRPMDRGNHTSHSWILEWIPSLADKLEFLVRAGYVRPYRNAQRADLFFRAVGVKEGTFVNPSGASAWLKGVSRSRRPCPIFNSSGS